MQAHEIQAVGIDFGTAGMMALVSLGGYLCGSIPFGYLLVRLTQGRDIRDAGSGNIGAANVTRTAGKGLGVLTLFSMQPKGSFRCGSPGE